MMKWWQILISVLFSVPLVYGFVSAIIVSPLIDAYKRNKKFTNWNKEHPDLRRRKCYSCKYCRSETYWAGHYPNGIPQRFPVYCTYLRKRFGGLYNEIRCQIPEPPTPYFYEVKNHRETFPCSEASIYYSAYGSCYHSTPKCNNIKKSHHIYTGSMGTWDRNPCSKCWIEKDGILYPKND